MKLVFLVSCLVATVMGSDVVELTDADFDSKIATFDTSLVEFFAPWCGHCKKLAPEYEKAATALKKDDTPVTLVKVDCIANTAACSKYGVSGYPTLKIFRGADVSSDYNGPRQADGIVSYMKKQVEPSSRQLDTVDDFDKFIGRENAVVIGFFASPDDADAKAYVKLTSALREDYSFGHSYSKEVSEKAEISGGVVLFRPKRLANKFEDARVKLTEKINQDNVKSFLKKNFHGLCGHMTSDNMDQFEKPLLTAYYKVDYVKDQKGTNYWRNRVMKIGKNYQDDLHLSIANGADFNHVITDAGLTLGNKPIVMIVDGDDKKYVMEEEFTTDGKSLDAFIKSYLAGEIKPKIKSEPVPESQDGPVTVVVGETFNEIVMDETKDVLIEFYAPWCGHCKTLAPKWDELGEKLKDNNDVIIAKMDATANDSPSQFAVQGFPTIYWAPKGNKKNPVKYSGGREVDDFVAYIESNASPKEKTEL